MSKTKEQLKYDVRTHYAFGRNWSEYSRLIEKQRIESASKELQSLAGNLVGRSFLDIGCGSGLHALCALQLGADRVVALDIDPDSVETTRRVVREHWSADNFECRMGNIFDLRDADECFDVVYSWGVLHHTGAMWTAIEAAARAVAPGGNLVIAIYRKTPLCGFWRIEKRIYRRLPRILQYPLDVAYGLVCCLGYLVVGRNPVRVVRSYRDRRGMSWWHNIRDWLGGFPYESATPNEVQSFLRDLGFELVLRRKDEVASRIVRSGLLGSGCIEYKFSRARFI